MNPSSTLTKPLSLATGVCLHLLVLSPFLSFKINTGRPQRDGPALRSTTFMLYANWLLANDNVTWVKQNLWPVIKLDLDYVETYWNRTTYVSANSLPSVTDVDQFRLVGRDWFLFILYDCRSTQGAEGGYCSRPGAWPN